MSNTPKVTAIDHIVLTAENLDITLAFYTKCLGMSQQSFTPCDGGSPRYALSFGNQKINLHSVKSPYSPHALRPTTGALDLCFLSDLPLEIWQDIFQSFNVAIEAGPIQRTGAQGSIDSLYVRDPDGNLIEISNSKAV